jgi:hypothetical protein
MARYRKLDILSPKELGEIQGFLGELKDATLFKARLKELEDLKAEINAAIEIHGKTQQIDGLLSDAIIREEASRNVQEQLLKDRDAASREIDVEKAASRQLIADRERDAQARIADREKALVDGERDLGEREKVLAKANDALIAKDLRVAQDLSDAKNIRRIYTEAVASLKAALERELEAL